MERPNGNYRSRVYVSWVDTYAFGAYNRFGAEVVVVYHDKKHPQLDDIEAVVGRSNRLILGWAALGAPTSLKPRRTSNPKKRSNNDNK